MKISRHKTAISRTNFSKPIQVALASNIIADKSCFFDYGCGKGDDIRSLKSLGHDVSGWDPTHKPKAKLKNADVVNLGFVVNVIEDPNERIDAVKKAYNLTNKVLIVSSRLTFEIKNNNHRPYKDGFLTARKTFQKFYTQEELKSFIDTTLNVNSVPGAPGVFFVFKDESLKSEFEANRYRRRPVFHFKLNINEIFEENKPILRPIIDFLLERGRLPDSSEVKNSKKLKEKFGTIKRAFSLIERVLKKDDWAEVEAERSEDLLVYLGLSKFGGRPAISKLPKDIQLDIKAFFGNFKTACSKADDLLFSAGNQRLISEACQKAPCGKLIHDALYIHQTCLPKLSPILRIYEGCAKAYIGEVEEANIIKFHRYKPKVSYLSYPDFDKNPHPGLKGALVVPLKSFDVKFYDYSKSENPPILHRKEEFVSDDYPHKKKFKKLTEQEEKHGLFDNPRIIGRKDTWDSILEKKGLRLGGHKLVQIT
ncbi:MAG: DNA phosphorothioation-associated putative methyltransferase [Nitrospina sp.]|nr:DNA phosphorothioation-associated putative methyltransferase [Nitrospina sp.]